MAKIKTPSYITGISGKVCNHENNEYRTNSSSGKIVLSKKCNPFNGAPTDKQKAIRSDFKKRSSAIRSWLAANKTTKTEDGKEIIEFSKAYKAAQSEKKQLHLDNIQAVLAQYMTKNADGSYTVNYDGSSITGTTTSGGSSGSSSSTPGGGSGGSVGGDL